MLKHIATICFLLLLLTTAAFAADEPYKDIQFDDLLHTLIKFNALNVMEDDNLLDEYAAITDCDLYTYYYRDDFKWNQIRTLVRKSVLTHMAAYPSRYHFDAKFSMDRYDFNDELYHFAKKNPVNRVNVLTLYSFIGPVCGEVLAKYLPLTFKAKLDPSVTIAGLRMTPEAAESMLNYMDATGNTDHVVYARFNFTVIYIEPLHKVAIDARYHNYAYYQSKTTNSAHILIMDVRVDSIDFYQDGDMTKMVYSYKPSAL